MEKFLHCGSAKKVIYCGSMDDYANPLLGIEHHNDSCAAEMWKSSYIVEGRKGSYITEAGTIMLIHC